MSTGKGASTCGAVHGQAVLGLATEEGIHWLFADLTQKVPERQVHSADGLDWQTFAAIVDGRPGGWIEQTSTAPRGNNRADNNI